MDIVEVFARRPEDLMGAVALHRTAFAFSGKCSVFRKLIEGCAFVGGAEEVDGELVVHVGIKDVVDDDQPIKGEELAGRDRLHAAVGSGAGRREDRRGDNEGGKSFRALPKKEEAGDAEDQESHRLRQNLDGMTVFFRPLVRLDRFRKKVGVSRGKIDELGSVVIPIENAVGEGRFQVHKDFLVDRVVHILHLDGNVFRFSRRQIAAVINGIGGFQSHRLLHVAFAAERKGIGETFVAKRRNTEERRDNC